MAHIRLADGLPGIRGLLVYSPATAKPIGELAEVLLRGPSEVGKRTSELGYVNRDYSTPVRE